MPAQCGDRIEAIRIRDPTKSTRRDAGQSPSNVVLAAQLRFLRDELTKQRAANVAESNNR